MGTTYRRLQVEVTGSVGGFNAAMNRVLRSTSQVAQGFRSGQRDANLFNKQLMAIGTTARYALAGQLVFGITGAINRLSDFKAELGTIDSLAGRIDKQGNFHSIGNQLNQVGTQAFLMSNKLGIAVADVEQYMQRFYSSFQGQPVGQMSGFVNRVGMLQAQMGSEAGDPQALAGGIAGLINNIPGGRKNISGQTKRIANLISFLTAATPNITGRDIARDIGRIGQTQTIARLTPEQAFAVWGVAGKSGGSSSVIGRGVTQLLAASLLHPTSPKQIAAYHQAGLPTDPTTLRNMGGFEVLSRMLRSVGPRNLTKRQRSILNDENIDDATANSSLGMNLTQVYALLGRQESVRQFVSLLGQGGVKALQDYIKHQGLAIKADQQRQRYDAASRQRTLKRFTEARTNLSTQLVAGADWPIEHLLANPTIAASNFAAKHRTLTQIGVGGALSLGAASSLRRLGAFQKLGKFGKVGKALSGINAVERAAIGGAITAEELPAAMAGGATDGTRANPFWVIISPLSWAVGSPGGLAAPVNTPGNKNVSNTIKKIAGKVAPPVASAAATSGFLAGDAALGATGVGLPLALLLGAAYFGGKGGGPPSALQHILAANQHKKLPGSVMPPLEGTLYGTFDVVVKHPDGTTTKVTKRGVPVRLWNQPQFPTSKGKPGSRKGGR